MTPADFTRTVAAMVAENDRGAGRWVCGDAQRVLVQPRGGASYAVNVTYVEDEAGMIRVNIKPDREGQEIAPDDFRYIMGRLNIPLPVSAAADGRMAR